MIGPEGDFHIGLEGVAVNLLAYFSPSAKEALVDEGGTAICIPDGSKEPLRWIYKYMQAGETDPEGEWTFEQLSVDCLITIYSHSAPLFYQRLMDRVVGRLKGKYHEVLPTVQEIKDFRDFVPPLYDYVVNILAFEFINPWTCDYSAYTEFAMVDKGFGDKLEKTVRKLLKHRVKTAEKYYEGAKNRHVLWSKQYYANLSKGGVNATTQGFRKPKVKSPVAPNGNSKNDEPAAAAPKKMNRRGGRKSEKATRKVVPASNDGTKAEKPPADKIAEVEKKRGGRKSKKATNGISKPGGSPTGKDLESERKRRKANAVLCWNCNGHGHLARDCTVSSGDVETAEKPKPKPKPTVRGSTSGLTEKSTKRAARTHRGKRDRLVYPIEVTGNGEGLRTCDREVRSGELTRTGLVI